MTLAVERGGGERRLQCGTSSELQKRVAPPTLPAASLARAPRQRGTMAAAGRTAQLLGGAAQLPALLPGLLPPGSTFELSRKAQLSNFAAGF